MTVTKPAELLEFYRANSPAAVRMVVNNFTRLPQALQLELIIYMILAGPPVSAPEPPQPFTPEANNENT